MVPKFRCWDERLGLTEVVSIDFFRKKIKINHWEYGDSNFFPLDEVVLMQSTGLKDKNGVDIFEGDLVKQFSNINKFTDDFAEDIEPTYGTTSIVRDGACFKTTFKGLPSLVLNQNGGSMAEHMEVIGDVWENPNLLEQANEK
jgi:uncharacterized phage protein (TIGR01671 family)